MADRTQLSQLPTNCIRITTQRHNVRIDDAPDETEQCYLTVEGTPEGFRWLSEHLQSLATSAERSSTQSGNIVAPRDFKNAPIDLDGWDSIDFRCYF